MSEINIVYFNIVILTTKKASYYYLFIYNIVTNKIGKPLIQS